MYKIGEGKNWYNAVFSQRQCCLRKMQTVQIIIAIDPAYITNSIVKIIRYITEHLERLLSERNGISAM